MSDSITLAEATFEQIVDELESRYRTVVIATDRQALGEEGNGTSAMLYDLRGTAFSTLGAVRFLMMTAEDYVRSMEEEEDE